MGLAIPLETFEDRDYARFRARLEDCLSALSRVLEDPAFGAGPSTLGAELELSIVDDHGRALPRNVEVLGEPPDPTHQLELNRFNLEYNSEPLPAAGRPFSQMQQQLEHAIESLDARCAAIGGEVACIGILPTLDERDLRGDVLTPLPRYRALSSAIRALRKEPFAIDIDGDDPLRLAWDDVTLEGAATSFQVHLRVPPQHFAALYNAAQLATPVVVAACSNSPIFLWHRLWEETRIALFKQAVDSRVPARASGWRPPSRVSFGHGYVREGAHELFAESVRMFEPLLPVVGDEDPLQAQARGELPRLDELRLHGGTIWRWNRPVYDASAGGHLRIELRALPSGPSPRDMVANAAFLLGLTQGLAPRIESLLAALPFAYAHHNFYRAAQHGLDATLLWPSAALSPQERPAKELALSLIDTAAEGLVSLGVEPQEIEAMLALIRDRLVSGSTGARWLRRGVDRLLVGSDRREAITRVFDQYRKRSRSDQPVHTWSDPS